jgi:hypothetical protein
VIEGRRAARGLALLAATVLGSCTSGQVGQLQVTSVNPATYGKLQFGVGWATSYPTSIETNVAGYGVNFVATFRQSNGRSAALTDNILVLVPGPLGTQLAQLVNTDGTSNFEFPAGTAALGAGINNGAPTVYGQYLENVGSGGPPAFPPPADATSSTKGFSEGYYASFPIIPVGMGDASGLPLASALATFPGQYTLQVTLPTATSSTVLNSVATLAGKPLPVFVPPVAIPDGNGGALVTITVPAGVTESIVTVTGEACQTQTVAAGASPAPVQALPQAYTLVSHKTGPGTDRLSLPDFITPIADSGQYQSLCPSAKLGLTQVATAYAVGFDYPAFESLYPQNLSEAPAIVGAAGQPDITLSTATTFSVP